MKPKAKRTVNCKNCSRVWLRIIDHNCLTQHGIVLIIFHFNIQTNITALELKLILELIVDLIRSCRSTRCRSIFVDQHR